MFVSLPRVLAIDVHKNADEKIDRIRIKNGDVFLTAFLSKKMPPLPDTIHEGSQLMVNGFIKQTESEKYGKQFSMTATSIVELGESNKPVSTTTEPGQPVMAPPSKTTKPKAPKENKIPTEITDVIDRIEEPVEEDNITTLV